MKKKKPATGYARMVELGAKGVRVWLDPAELLAITKAAQEAHLPLSTYIRRAAFEVACRSRFKVRAHGFTDYGPGG